MVNAFSRNVPSLVSFGGFYASSLDQCCQAAGRLNRFQQLANFFLFRQLRGLPQGPMAAWYSSMQLGTWETHGNTADKRSKWVRCSEPQMFSLGRSKVLCLGATQNSHTKISALCHLESSRLKACEESHHTPHTTHHSLSLSVSLSCFFDVSSCVLLPCLCPPTPTKNPTTQLQIAPSCCRTDHLHLLCQRQLR